MDEAQYAEMARLYGRWLGDAVTVTGPLERYFSLLLSGDLGPLTSAQREFSELGVQFALDALDRWWFPLYYLRLRSGKLNVLHHTEGRPLSSLFEEVRALWQRRAKGALEITPPAEDVVIRYITYLRTVLDALIIPRFAYYYTNHVTIAAALDDAMETVKLVVQTGMELEADPALRPESLFFPGSPLSVAELMVEQYGSKLEIERLAQGTIFRFAVPIWREEATE